MTDITQTSVHDLLRLRGDTAIAGLKAIHDNMRTLTEGIGAVLAEMEKLETHYALTDTTGKGPMAALVSTVRKMRPEATAGMTDQEVIDEYKLGGK